MARPKHIRTLEQTSVGANGFRLQHLLDQRLYQVIHSHLKDGKDKVDRTYFIEEKSALKYFETLLKEAKETQINQSKIYPLITKII